MTYEIYYQNIDVETQRKNAEHCPTENEVDILSNVNRESVKKIKAKNL